MKYSYLVLLLFLCTAVFGQRGKNGALTVNSTVTVNEYTTLTANASVGNTSITVAASSLNAHNRFSKSLAAGDLIMIIQMQGATIKSGVNDSTWGDITSYNNAGVYELCEVSSVPNNTTINVDCPLINNYTSAGAVQVVRIPRYTTLTVNAAGTINCDAWGGQTGGIVAIEVEDATIVNGNITADSLGFRGGAILDNVNGTNSISFDSNSVCLGAQKGESIAGYQSQYNIYGGMYGRGAPADGGGGGDQWNASGGGGGNGGNIALYNGNGNPDTTNRSWDSAWNLEYAGFNKNVSSGGGRGGYTISWFPVGTPDPNQVPPGNLDWGSIDRNRMNAGGKGGRPMDYSTSRLFVGGGGGAGHEDQSLGGPGGNGGGIIYMQTYGTVSGSGSIHSNGGAGGNDNSVNQLGDGMGGGGAGGSIIINSTATISGVTVSVNGGRGGYQYITSSYENEGPGGGGGGGHIELTNLGLTTSISGGINGVTDSPYMTLFPPDGATKGGVGDVDSIAGYTIKLKNDTICQGNRDTLRVTLVGNIPPGLTIEWFDSLTGGTMQGSGLTFVTPVIYKTTIFYVTSCPGDYRIPDTVFVRQVSPQINGSDDSICKGGTAILSATGGSSYMWSTGQTTSSISVSPLVTTVYTLTAYLDGCSADTTFTVTIRPKLTAATSALPDTICPYGISIVKVAGGNGTVAFKWNTGGTHDTINVKPGSTTTYSVIIYGKCDTITDSVIVHTSKLTKPIIAGKNSQCKGVPDTLTVSGATQYFWSNGSTGDTYITGNIQGDSSILVVGFNSLGCPDTTRFAVSIFPAPAVTLLDTNTCLNNPVIIYALANDSIPLTYKWTPGGGTGSSITVPDTGITYTVNVSNGCKTTEKIKLVPVITNINACCDKTILKGDDTILVVHGIAGGVNSYSWSPEVSCLTPNCDSVKVNPTVTTTYTVVGADSLGCQTEQVLTIIVETACTNLTIPNVFTPTEQGVLGLNNIFYIKTENMSVWSEQVFDRWGKEVFNTTNPDQYWDGKAQGGGEAPAGVYYYIINGTCQNTTYKKDGFVQLIR